MLIAMSIEDLKKKCENYEQVIARTAEDFKNTQEGRAVQERIDEIIRLRQQVEDLEFELRTYSTKTDEMAAERKYLRTRLESEVSAIKGANHKIMDLNHEIRKRDEQIIDYKKKMDQIKEQTDRFLNYVNKLTDQLKSVESKACEMISQNSEELVVKTRGRAPMDDLTPRPNYKKLLSDKKIELLLQSEGTFTICMRILKFC